MHGPGNASDTHNSPLSGGVPPAHSSRADGVCPRRTGTRPPPGRRVRRPSTTTKAWPCDGLVHIPPRGGDGRSESPCKASERLASAQRDQDEEPGRLERCGGAALRWARVARAARFSGTARQRQTGTVHQHAAPGGAVGLGRHLLHQGLPAVQKGIEATAAGLWPAPPGRERPGAPRRIPAGPRPLPRIRGSVELASSNRRGSCDRQSVGSFPVVNQEFCSRVAVDASVSTEQRPSCPICQEIFLSPSEPSDASGRWTVLD